MVNRSDSFEETSGSIFIVYGFAKGINNGWLPNRYRDVAMSGWRGRMSKKTENRAIEGNTGSVLASTSPIYYLNNSTKQTDNTYLYGALFLVGTEMLELYKDPENLKTTIRIWHFNHNHGALKEPTN